MKQLDAYWPNQKEIQQCIKTEAETASDAVLLAVHQPTPIAIREEGTLLETTASEHTLLEAFLTEDLPEGTLLFPITGQSGVGKSHIIRWLSAQLNRIKDAKRLEVIRIPKSANLKTVVELILEPLTRDSRYSSVKEKLEKAVSEVNPKDGAIRFVAELKISLRDFAEQIESQLRSKIGNRIDREQSRALRTRLGHAKKLPDFFNDAQLQEHFESKVLGPIIERAIQGRKETVDEEVLPQFSINDLIIPEEIDLANASLSVRNYYLTTLNSETGQGREVAVDVLNSVIDTAISRVFNLDQAIGGVTLEEIILHIRQLLFEDNKELVLLIEDFAALSGIQEILLKVCIQEAERDGEKIRAPMRTALAVTDGYLASRDTILTRAKREWVIKSNLNDSNEIIERTTNLVGAYLNAARWGDVELQQMFSNSSKDSEESLTQWIHSFEDQNISPEEATIINAFGRTSSGYPLFPYNKSAIMMLTKHHLMISGELIFNPRRILNYILREVLLQRDAFEKNKFPPKQFKQTNPSADISSWLAHAQPNNDIRERLKSFIVYWGGNPQTPEDVAELSPELFNVFGLPSPKELGQNGLKTSTPKVAEATVDRPVTIKQESIEATENKEIQNWKNILNEWSNGKELDQQKARNLRNFIEASIKKYIDWNALCMSPRPLKMLIYIPNARGNDRNFKYQLKLADDHSDPSGELQKTLLALIRYDIEKSWNYSGGDEDSAYVANMVERLGDEISDLLSQERDMEIPSVASILIKQGQILGILPKKIKSPDFLSNAVVRTAQQQSQMFFSNDTDEGKWEEFKNEIIRLRKSFQRELFDKVACFQGATGKKVFALDIVRLTLNNTELGLEYEASHELKAHKQALSDRRLGARIKPLKIKLLSFYAMATDILGEHWDKNSFLDSFKELLTVLEDTASYPVNAPGKIKINNKINEIRKVSLKEQLDNIKPLLDEELEPSSEIVISNLGKVDLKVINDSKDFLELVDAFVKQAEQSLKIRAQTFQGVSPEKNILEINTELDSISNNLEIVTKKRSSS